MGVDHRPASFQTERRLPPALWALSVVLAATVPDTSNGSPGQIAAAAAVLAVLLGIAYVKLPDASPIRLDWRWAAWFALFSVAGWLACRANPLFGFLAWSGFLLAPAVFPGRLLWIGVVLTAAVTALSQIGGDLGAEASTLAIYLGILLANAGIAGMALHYSAGNERQSEQRRAALEEAETANAALEEALEENRALQEQLVLGAREAGVADERARLAREIHDTIAQGLSGIVRQLEAADGADAAEVARRIDTARTLARDSLAEARRSVQALRPEPLEGAHLPEALASVAGDWSRLHGIPARVTTTGAAQPLHPEVDVALLRTAQEALANVGKHARATRVGVTLSYMGDAVTLDVRDDGVGFVAGGDGTDGTAAGGYGLHSMRERLAAVDGRLEIETAPGDGTAVSASVPALEAR